MRFEHGNKFATMRGSTDLTAVSGDSYAPSENSDSVGLAKGPLWELPMTGVRWVARVLEYWLEEEAWFEPIPIDDGYGVLDASMAMVFLEILNHCENGSKTARDLR